MIIPMLETIKALLSSRKVWVGTLTVFAVISATLLVALGKLDQAQFVPTIGAITVIGLGVIGSIAWEDAAEKRGAASTNIQTTSNAVETQTVKKEGET